MCVQNGHLVIKGFKIFLDWNTGRMNPFQGISCKDSMLKESTENRQMILPCTCVGSESCNSEDRPNIIIMYLYFPAINTCLSNL